MKSSENGLRALVIGYPRTGFTLLISVISAICNRLNAFEKVPGQALVQTFCNTVGLKIAEQIKATYRKHGLKEDLIYNDNFKQGHLDKAMKGVFRFFSSKKVNIRTTRPANRVAALSRKWITKVSKGDKPFFLWIHFFDPHSPYLSHPDFKKPKVVIEYGKLNKHGEKEANYINEIEFADFYLARLLQRVSP